MKKLIFFFVFASLSFSLYAKSTPLTPCTSNDLVALEESINDWGKEGFSHVRYMKNTQGDILGFYSWGESVGMYAEVCEYIGKDLEDFTVASQWYYWDEDSSEDPSTWIQGQKYRISQDEGIAYIKVLKTLENGNVEALFSVVGWDENSKEKVLKANKVIFQNK